MASLLARNMISVGVASVYLSGSRSIMVSATAVSPGSSSAGSNMDGMMVPSDTIGKPVRDQLGMHPFDELDDLVPGDLVELSKETSDSLAAAAAGADAAAEETEHQVVESLCRLGFERQAAELIAGLAKFEKVLLFETDGADHDAAVRAFALAPLPAEFKQQLKGIKAQIVSRLGSEGAEAIGLLEGVTLGEILIKYFELPQKPEAEPFLAMLRSIVLPKDRDVDPKTTLDVLTKLLATFENLPTQQSPSDQIAEPYDSTEPSVIGSETSDIAALTEQFKLTVSDAEFLAGFLRYESVLIFGTGTDHEAVLTALKEGAGKTPSEVIQKLRSVKGQIEAQISSQPDFADAVAVLKVLTIGEILLNLTKGAEAELILAELQAIISPEGAQDDPQVTLEQLKQLLVDVGGTNHPYSPTQLTAAYGLSQSDAEMLYSVLELEKRVFGPEGLDHDDAESIVLRSTGTRQFAETFDRLKQIEVMLKNAARVDKDLLEAVAIAEIMLRLPTGEDGKQLMGAVRAMVTSGQLTYKQAIQLRDSLPDPTLGDSERKSDFGSSPPTTTSTTTTTTDEPTSATGQKELPGDTMEPEFSEKSTVEVGANRGLSGQSISKSEGAGFEASKEDADESDTDHGLSDHSISESRGAGFEASEEDADESDTDHGLSDHSISESRGTGFETSEEDADESDTDQGLSNHSISESEGAGFEASEKDADESDTDHGLSDQNIMVITIVSVLALMVAGIVVAAAVRKSRRRNNTKNMRTSIDLLPPPPISSEYETTAVLVDQNVYSDSVDAVV